MSDKDRDFVQSLDRGLAVLRTLSGQPSGLTLSEVAVRTGLSRAAARRFLHTLVQLGYVGAEAGAFSLRPRLLELGHGYLSGLELPEVAQPHLRALSEATGESTSVAVLDGADVVYIARVAAYRIMSVAIRVGTRFPAFATSMGRALLGCSDRQDELLAMVELRQLTPHTVATMAQLRKRLTVVREQGWALVDQELEEGLRSVAAPIRDASGTVIAAINISAPAQRRGIAEIEAELVGPLLAAAAGIEEDLRHQAGTAR